MFTSLYVSEKKATSAPDIRNEIVTSISAVKIRIVVAAGFIDRRVKRDPGLTAE